MTAATQVAEVDLAELAASNKATVCLWYSPNMEQVISETMTPKGTVTSASPVMTVQVK